VKAFPIPATPDETVDVAAGSTLGLQEFLLASDGQVGLNTLAVGFTNTGKVSGTSLGAGNVVEVYASGADFNSGTVLYREFMNFGEHITFTGLSSGAIIKSSQGFYGVSEINYGGTTVATMPLLSLGLSFETTFMFGFRHNENTGGTTNGFIFVVNGPLESEVSVTYGDGSFVPSAPDQTLGPWELGIFHLQGNVEYIVNSSNNVMACTAVGFNDTDPNAATSAIGAGPRDARLIMPLTNDGITHPRSGNMSALFDGTVVSWFDMQGHEGQLNNGAGINPGTPIDMDQATPNGTGNGQTDYDPIGFTRFKAVGLISGYSGADGAGGDATPMCPVSAMSQVVAQPFFINDSGNGDQGSITIASPYTGTARIYEYNTGTGGLDLAYTVPLIRDGVTVTTKEDQNHPAAGQLAPTQTGTGRVAMVGQLNAGVIIADVPIMVIAQSNGTPAVTVRSQNGTTTTPTAMDDDETLLFGITPDSIRAEIREDADGILRKRVIDNTGAETWVVA